MTPMTFVRRVTIDSVVLLAALAVPAVWLAGGRGLLGVLAGGMLALGNLWWLAGRAVAATSTPDARPSLAAVVRLAAVAVGAVVLLATGLAHPVAVVAGLTVLPCALVARGLAAVREA